MDTNQTASAVVTEGERVDICCNDGLRLGGHLWIASGAKICGSVIINPATGVLASYYHRYARFLAEHGFDVLTYDYRGIGLSRPARLRGCGYRWRDWGELDVEAALAFMQARNPDQPLSVVGHSIGGVLPGFAKNASAIDRMLTVGAQFGYWGDYAPEHRKRLFWKWHVAMPLMTAVIGYFPGRRLGWLEDLPAGVANEWSSRGAQMERSYRAPERDEIIKRLDAVRAPILAVGISDDPIGTMPAIRRGLSCYKKAATEQVALTPANLGFDSIGHFGLFHSRHAAGFWLDTVLWLRDGINPWPRQRAHIPPSEGHNFAFE